MAKILRKRSLSLKSPIHSSSQNQIPSLFQTFHLAHSRNLCFPIHIFFHKFIPCGLSTSVTNSSTFSVPHQDSTTLSHNLLPPLMNLQSYLPWRSMFISIIDLNARPPSVNGLLTFSYLTKWYLLFPSSSPYKKQHWIFSIFLAILTGTVKTNKK